jgi:hypothetical protein
LHRKSGSLASKRFYASSLHIGELAEFLFKHRGQAERHLREQRMQRVCAKCRPIPRNQRITIDRNWLTMRFQELYKNWVTALPYCPCTLHRSEAWSAPVWSAPYAWPWHRSEAWSAPVWSAPYAWPWHRSMLSLPWKGRDRAQPQGCEGSGRRKTSGGRAG